ncbi:MAG TPA: hypothetical protein VM012_08860 [Flavitalea sp.]|nr:hypothetical protein [Flavitalea sp.]
MKLHGNIKKISLLIIWTILGSSVLVLLIAAVQARNNKFCQGLVIDINGSAEGEWFLEKKDVISLITMDGTVAVKSRPLDLFDLRSMELRLKKNIWIRKAELFFDKKNRLQVKIEERIPIARIFTISGNSFYIDSSCKKLPLSSRLSARLPVFTNYPIQKFRSNKQDSFFLKQVRDLSWFILNDKFWMAQVAQVDITPERKFEIVPTVGNHVIQFGDAYNAGGKFHNLMIFYQQVLAKTGFDKYKIVNVEYARQVIGVRKLTAQPMLQNVPIHNEKQLNTIQ